MKGKKGLLLLPLMVFLVACQSENNTSTTTNPTSSNTPPSAISSSLESSSSHTHVADSTWHTNETYHWHLCQDDNVEMDKAEHTFSNWEVSKASTHLVDGEEKRTCSICGYIETRIIEKGKHTADANAPWQSDSTGHWKNCSANDSGKVDFAVHTFKTEYSSDENKHWHECEVCGYKIDEANHEYKEVVDAKYLAAMANCTQAATYYKSCVCGKVSTDTFTSGEPLGHRADSTWHNNETYHWHLCQDDNVEMDKAEHTFPETWTTIKTATHAQEGEEERSCTTCGYKQTRIIDKLTTHTFDTAWHYDKDDGSKGHYHICSVDQTKSKYEDHNFGDWQTVEAATHAQEGSEKRTCKDCGYEETRPIDKLTTHTFDDKWHSDETGHWHECTLDDDGKSEVAVHQFKYDHNEDSHWQVCSICEYKTKNENHNFGEIKITKDSTYEEDGEGTQTCTTCGYTKTVVVPKTVKDFASYGASNKTDTTTLNGNGIEEVKQNNYLNFDTSNSVEKIRIITKEKYKNVTSLSFDAMIVGSDNNGTLSQVGWFGFAHGISGFNIYSGMKTTSDKTTNKAWKNYTFDVSNTFSADGDYIGIVCEAGDKTNNVHDVIRFDNIKITTSDGNTYTDDFENAPSSSESSLFSIDSNYTSSISIQTSPKNLKDSNSVLSNIKGIVIDHSANNSNPNGSQPSAYTTKSYTNVKKVTIRAKLTLDTPNNGTQAWWGININNNPGFYPDNENNTAHNFDYGTTDGVKDFVANLESPQSGQIGIYFGMKTGKLYIREVIIETENGTYDLKGESFKTEFTYNEIERINENEKIVSFEYYTSFNDAITSNDIYSTLNTASYISTTSDSIALSTLEDNQYAVCGNINFSLFESNDLLGLIIADDTENKVVTYIVLSNNAATLYKNNTAYETITLSSNILDFILTKNGTLSIKNSEGNYQELTEKVTSIITPKLIKLYGEKFVSITEIKLYTQK